MMCRNRLEVWLIIGFLLALVIIGINQNSFNPARFAVSYRPLMFDFKDQKVRVIGWKRNYAAITVHGQEPYVGFPKKHFAVLVSRNHQIVLKEIKNNDLYIMGSWLVLSYFKQYQDHVKAMNIIELNGENVFTIQLPHDIPVIIHGKVLEATGCKVVKEIK